MHSHLRRLIWFPLTGLFLLLLVFVLLGDVEKILCHVADDAAYYFEIAENIAAGRGATFDGIVSTNGYQPFWLLCLIPLAWIFDAAPETMLRKAISSNVSTPTTPGSQ